MKKLTTHIPNTVTMLNLLSGSISIILAFSGDLFLASWFIFLAAFLDFMDGMLARWLNAKSDIGAQLDSLADVISFGLAPSVILYLLLAESSSLPAWQAGNIPLIPLASLLIVAASAYRLAKFNIDPRQEHHFLGLPTPAAGIFIASIPLILDQYNESAALTDFIGSPGTLLIIIFLLSSLMVSNLPLLSLKLKNYGWQKSWPAYILIGPAPFFILFFHYLGIPLIIVLYIIISLIRRPLS